MCITVALELHTFTRPCACVCVYVSTRVISIIPKIITIYHYVVDGRPGTEGDNVTGNKYCTRARACVCVRVHSEVLNLRGGRLPNVCGRTFFSQQLYVRLLHSSAATGKYTGFVMIVYRRIGFATYQRRVYRRVLCVRIAAERDTRTLFKCFQCTTVTTNSVGFMGTALP